MEGANRYEYGWCVGNIQVGSRDLLFVLANEMEELDFAARLRAVRSPGLGHGSDREDRLRAQPEIVVNVPIDVTETKQNSPSGLTSRGSAKTIWKCEWRLARSASPANASRHLARKEKRP